MTPDGPVRSPPQGAEKKGRQGQTDPFAGHIFMVIRRHRRGRTKTPKLVPGFGGLEEGGV